MWISFIRGRWSEKQAACERAADKGECGNCFSVVTYNESSLCQNKYPAGIIVDNKTASSEDADIIIFIRVSCTWGQWRG